MGNKKIFKFVASIVLIAIMATAIHLIMSKKSYEVSFVSEDDTVIKVDEVQRNDSADPPVTPQMPYGKIFSHWDTDFSKVKDNLIIKAVTEDTIGKANVFAMSGAYGKKDNEVVVPLKLTGEVLLSGFDILIKYNADGLELASVFNEDGGIVCNSEKPGEIRINYVSSQNTIGEVDICSFKLIIKSDEQKSIPLEITADKVCAVKDDETIYDTEYSIINANVYVIG